MQQQVSSGEWLHIHRHDVRILDDLDAVSQAVIDELATIVPLVLAEQDTFSIALSGGSTPKRLLAMLAKLGRDALPWDKIEVFFGDERCVAPDHADSNYRMAKDSLFDPLKLDGKRIHRMRGEDTDPAGAAKAYEDELRPLCRDGGWPVFDYVLLGMGSDGHTASLFPGSPALHDVARWCVANEVDSPLTKGKATRLTLTAAAINHARRVRFLVCGADKAEALDHVLQGGARHEEYPAQLIHPYAGRLVWFVDRAAAAKLEDRTETVRKGST